MDKLEQYEAYYRLYLGVYVGRYPDADMARAQANRQALEEAAMAGQRLENARALLEPLKDLEKTAVKGPRKKGKTNADVHAKL